MNLSFVDVITLFAKSGTAWTPTFIVNYGGIFGERFFTFSTFIIFNSNQIIDIGSNTQTFGKILGLRYSNLILTLLFHHHHLLIYFNFRVMYPMKLYNQQQSDMLEHKMRITISLLLLALLPMYLGMVLNFIYYFILLPYLFF